ncbi:MAG: hypothetical protein U0935_15780 [Pirellulales bacterium]
MSLGRWLPGGAVKLGCVNSERKRGRIEQTQLQRKRHEFHGD